MQTLINSAVGNMNEAPYMMGQTKQEDFAAMASTNPSAPLNFAAQDFSFHANNGKTSQNQNLPQKDQSGRPSTPFPENEVHFLPNVDNATPELAAGLVPHNLNDGGAKPYGHANPVAATSSNHPDALYCRGGEGHQTQPFLPQQQSWPPSNMYYGQNPSCHGSEGSPFASGQKVPCYAASHGHVASAPPPPPPQSPPEREERIPNSATRRSRVWKYGRRSSGSHTDRSPFTFSIPASQASMEPAGCTYFGKRSFSNTSSDESWSTEPSPKQFISEDRMAAEMHSLSLDGFQRPPLFPLHVSSTSVSAPSISPTSPPPSSSSSSSSLHTSPPSCHSNSGVPSTRSDSRGPRSVDLLRHHQCHHHAPKSYSRTSLADIERRLDESDDEGVEEDMPPSSEGQRLEMTPELASALKAKGAENHMLPSDIVKKIATTSCMELVLWRPPSSILNPRGSPDSPSKASCTPSPPGSELAPIMEVEVEREGADASPSGRPALYPDMPTGDEMQNALPEYDEDMDL